jgi:acyl transferase domain-containing protein
VAIHRGVELLRHGRCDMALVGGVNTILIPELHMSFNRAGMLSEDGRCKAFSDQANGFTRGEGVGMMLLKRLRAAEADGDHIYGVIRGTAQNHGGRSKSLTAPNPKAQADLLLQAYSARRASMPRRWATSRPTARAPRWATRSRSTGSSTRSGNWARRPARLSRRTAAWAR